MTRGEGLSIPGRRLALIYWTAQFRAAGLALAALPLLSLARRGGRREDPFLLGALALLAAASLLVRGLLRRGRIDPASNRMALAFLTATLALELCMSRTGGMTSPVVLLVGGVAVAGALTLAPVAYFLLAAGIGFLHTLGAVAAAEGLLVADAAQPASFSLLIVELGLLLLPGFALHATRASGPE